ncbi:S66 family peptidase [Microlunatus speluncae]|uniref:S66 family peptidase n=1 Tax=Microlunatus speluncae TaxID=2594267 RepID=UPI00126670CA|nr:S66 peptidase family protein [Microlunatus speluncae]
MALKPGRLREGDTVAVVATSAGLAVPFPRVYQRGLAVLREEYGLEVREYPTTRLGSDQLWRDPAERAADLNEAFADPEIAAIITTIGGSDSIRILPHLDPEVARRNPKIMLGYSDTSTQLIFYQQLGLITFLGPSVMAGFAQQHHFPEARDHVRALLFDSKPEYRYRPYPRWSSADWDGGERGDEIGPVHDHDGWHWLQGGNPARGRLFGGCFETLEQIKGTQFWPAPSFWDDRILALETSEEAPSPDQVARWLRNYGMQGVFDRAAAILIGRACGYADDQKRELDQAVLRVIGDEFGARELPVVTNLDFGHTDPQWILPLGCLAEVDPAAGEIRLAESPLR